MAKQPKTLAALDSIDYKKSSVVLPLTYIFKDALLKASVAFNLTTTASRMPSDLKFGKNSLGSTGPGKLK